jgi:hypothetical protein
MEDARIGASGQNGACPSSGAFATDMKARMSALAKKQAVKYHRLFEDRPSKKPRAESIRPPTLQC